MRACGAVLVGLRRSTASAPPARTPLPMTSTRCASDAVRCPRGASERVRATESGVWHRGRLGQPPLRSACLHARRCTLRSARPRGPGPAAPRPAPGAAVTTRGTALGARAASNSRDAVVQLGMPGRQHTAAQQDRGLLLEQVQARQRHRRHGHHLVGHAGPPATRATGSPAVGRREQHRRQLVAAAVPGCAPGAGPRSARTWSPARSAPGSGVRQRRRLARGRPRRAPRTTAPPRRGPSRRPSRRRSSRARGSGRCGRRGSMPTQLMPAPHTTATPAGLVDAGPQHRERVVADLRRSRPSRARAARPPSRSSSTGRSALARQAETWSTRVRPGGPRRQRLADGLAPSPSTAALDARPRAAGTRRRGPCRAPSRRPRRRATSVLLLPASTARTPRRRGSDRPAGPTGPHAHEVLPVVRDQPVGERPRRTRTGRPAGGRAAPGTPGRGRRAAPPPGPGPRTPSRARSGRRTAGRRGATGSGVAPCGRRPRAGTSITASSGRNGRVPLLCVLTTWYGGCRRRPAATRPGPPPPPSRRPRRAWPAASGFSSSAGSAYMSSSCRLHRGDLGGPGRLRAQLAHDLVVGVEVAQVVRGDDAEPVQRRTAAGAGRVGDRVAVLGQQLRQHVHAVRAATRAAPRSGG